MKTGLKALLILALAGSATTTQAQGWKNVVNQATDALNKTKTSTGTSSLSNTDIVSGLKQALQVGTQNASGRLAAVNGYFGNSLIKILMPPEVKNVESVMRQAGMGSYVDKAILAMNRAAEDAAKQAAPIFVNAITQMTIQDGLSILKGSNDAATQYLKTKTSTSLTNAFKPVINSSLSKVNATKYWSDVFTMYNKIPLVTKKVNPDLSAYVTERALNGMFVQIAQEESKIRLDPAARVTDLLKKVFGNL